VQAGGTRWRRTRAGVAADANRPHPVSGCRQPECIDTTGLVINVVLVRVLVGGDPGEGRTSWRGETRGPCGGVQSEQNGNPSIGLVKKTHLAFDRQTMAQEEGHIPQGRGAPLLRTPERGSARLTQRRDRRGSKFIAGGERVGSFGLPKGSGGTLHLRTASRSWSLSFRVAWRWVSSV
jgi:hypothetical protein